MVIDGFWKRRRWIYRAGSNDFVRSSNIIVSGQYPDCQFVGCVESGVIHAGERSDIKPNLIPVSQRRGK